jgi:hypothetical protein
VNQANVLPMKLAGRDTTLLNFIKMAVAKLLDLASHLGHVYVTITD